MNSLLVVQQILLLFSCWSQWSVFWDWIWDSLVLNCETPPFGSFSVFLCLFGGANALSAFLFNKPTHFSFGTTEFDPQLLLWIKIQYCILSENFTYIILHLFIWSSSVRTSRRGLFSTLKWLYKNDYIKNAFIFNNWLLS